MKKETKVTEEITKEVKPEVQEAKTSPLAEIVKSIAALPQADRLVLYNRLDTIINHDRDKASQGIDGGTHLFDEAVKSLK
jgi:hypothetical protein